MTSPYDAKGGLIYRTTEPAYIEAGRVLDVNVEQYTLAVTTQFTKKPLTGVRFAIPYHHFANGEGIYFMPEVGSLCWICFPSDGNKPFVLAWAPAGVEGDFSSRRRALNPGDIFLGTRDDNFLVLRRGGVVQIGSGPINQRIFLPINNTIRDFCENYQLRSLAGDFEWTVARDHTTKDGHLPTDVTLRAREFADDKKPIAQLKIGSHAPDDTTILSLTINGDGSGGEVKVSLYIDKEGNCSWTVEQDYTFTVTGLFKVKANSIEMKADTSISEEAVTEITMKAGTTADLEAGAGVTVTAPIITLSSPAIVAGGGGGAMYPVAMVTPAFTTWMMTHTHMTLAPFSSTAPGTLAPPLPPDFISQVLVTK